jgi:DNA-3-methyladenine glycosylase
VRVNKGKLLRSFYENTDTLTVAAKLLGKKLVVPTSDGARVSGIIVEVEAYLGPEDKASHAYGHRQTARNKAMYGPGGTVYIFFIYGMYFQFNVVTNYESAPHAVLVRALEPDEGIDLMRLRRGDGKNDRELTSGPGKLCIALGIDRSYNMADLTGERIWIERARRVSHRDIVSGPRIGIDYAEEYAMMPWRFWIRDNIFVSRHRKNPARPDISVARTRELSS